MSKRVTVCVAAFAVVLVAAGLSWECWLRPPRFRERVAATVRAQLSDDHARAAVALREVEVVFVKEEFRARAEHPLHISSGTRDRMNKEMEDLLRVLGLQVVKGRPGAARLEVSFVTYPVVGSYADTRTGAPHGAIESETGGTAECRLLIPGYEPVTASVSHAPKPPESISGGGPDHYMQSMRFARQAVLACLGKADPMRLAAALENRDLSTCVAAVGAIGEPAIPVLILALGYERPSRTARWALVELGRRPERNQAVTDALTGASQSEDPRVRSEAAKALRGEKAG